MLYVGAIVMHGTGATTWGRIWGQDRAGRPFGYRGTGQAVIPSFHFALEAKNAPAAVKAVREQAAALGFVRPDDRRELMGRTNMRACARPAGLLPGEEAHHSR